MFKTILLRIFKPNHQPEMIISDLPFSDMPFRTEEDTLAIKLINKYWVKNRAANSQHSAEMIKTVAENILLDCQAIFASPDRRMANRAKLLEAVSRCAKMQVLVISPEPEADGTGLRGLFGITGELKSKILEVIEIDKEFHTFPENLDFEKAWLQIQYAYRRAWACMNIFEALRHEFNDFHPEQAQDWFRPFFATQCAYAEGNYRKELGMPSVLDSASEGVASTAAMYGDYANIVLEGVQYPDLIWEKKYPDLENPKTVWN
ncbi:MAG: hypothetical protein R8K20_09590 [Gallionellaceae bacterium]